MVRVFNSVVDSVLSPPASVRFPDTLAAPVVVNPLNVGASVVLKFWFSVAFPVSVKVLPPPVRVMSDPVTVSVRGVVPPVRPNPSRFEERESPLTVLFVKLSVPASVASVPVVGRVTFVAPVDVSVTALAPDRAKLPGRVSVPVVQVGDPAAPERSTCPARPCAEEPIGLVVSP